MLILFHIVYGNHENRLNWICIGVYLFSVSATPMFNAKRDQTKQS